MLYTSAQGALGTGTQQNDVVHLVSDIAQVQKWSLPFVFTDGHPLTTRLTKFSNDLNKLPTFLDWTVLLDYWWNDSDVDTDRKRRRQAEFLVYGLTPWRAVRGIVVKTEETKDKVGQIVQRQAYQPKILVLPEWYY
ncbi:hypothetical protein IAD21_03509 [Abditibacteriota bacterium]|nr:hypothetical protein IAD21_03509 [Abditibacteriota bacterium]